MNPKSNAYRIACNLPDLDATVLRRLMAPSTLGHEVLVLRILAWNSEDRRHVRNIPIHRIEARLGSPK